MSSADATRPDSGSDVKATPIAKNKTNSFFCKAVFFISLPPVVWPFTACEMMRCSVAALLGFVRNVVNFGQLVRCAAGLRSNRPLRGWAVAGFTAADFTADREPGDFAF